MIEKSIFKDGANKNLTHPNKEKGITLISLIITIIIMMILAGVTINIALNGGLFQKAEEAKTQTQLETDKEELQIAVVSALNDDLEIPNAGAIKNNLQEGWEVTLGEDGTSYTCTSPKENLFTVDKKGNISDGNKNPAGVDFEAIKQDVIANPETYLAKAKEVGQDIEALTDIGIGTDGNVVNLGSWIYTKLDENTVELTGGSGEAGYTGEIVGGKIVGSVPQYIYSEGKIYTVTQLNGTFSGLAGLKYAPKLPETVTTTWNLFMDSKDLEVAPELHEGLIIITTMFSGCTSLKNSPVIPSTANEISFMFSDCTSLTGTIIIKSESIIVSGPAYLQGMLENVGSAEKPIVLKGTENNLEILEAIRATGNSEYITIEQ